MGLFRKKTPSPRLRRPGQLRFRPGRRPDVVRRHRRMSERGLRARRLGPHELQNLGLRRTEAAGRQELTTRV